MCIRDRILLSDDKHERWDRGVREGRVRKFRTDVCEIRVSLFNGWYRGGLSSVFAFSAIILVLIGAQETKRLISNEPVVYFRCCGCDEKCCQNGPHNKGYSTRFIYRNDGRGYETRSAERMRAHLRVSKNCTPLEPLIVYPREAKWGWWGPNDLVRYQNEMLRMKEQKQGKFR